jgi:hypothetical protein
MVIIAVILRTITVWVYQLLEISNLCSVLHKGFGKEQIKKFALM